MKVASILCLLVIVVWGQQPVVPYDGMIVMQDTVFVPGSYNLPHGISIGSDNIVVNMVRSIWGAICKRYRMVLSLQATILKILVLQFTLAKMFK